MRIALTADPELPVPPLHYGGIERIVDMLARGLEAAGHDVTVFAHRDSKPAGSLVEWRGRSSRSAMDTLRNMATLTRRVLGGSFDLVHSFSRLAYLAPTFPTAIPKLMSYQREICRNSIVRATRLARGSLWFTAASHHMMKPVADVGTWRLVYNGVPDGIYDFSADPEPNAPLVFLGRIEAIKGPHLAIEVARRTGIPLVLAGTVAAEHESFFNAEIRPYLDPPRVTYVGPVDDRAKNNLLGAARALLMPILWEEPFGIVMVEAMACGTPVVGLGRGAVPEVVEHGVTGFVADDVDGLVDGVRGIGKIDRKACLRRVERLFSERPIVAAYEEIYREMVAAAGR